MPRLDRERCNGCGLCIEVCQMGALVQLGGMVTITETEACDWCTRCEAVCPTAAISCPFEIVIEG
jgi:MinD superfamily P-loop ATPase